jgi:hypothetical protein
MIQELVPDCSVEDHHFDLVGGLPSANVLPKLADHSPPCCVDRWIIDRDPPICFSAKEIEQVLNNLRISPSDLDRMQRIEPDQMTSKSFCAPFSLFRTKRRIV